MLTTQCRSTPFISTASECPAVTRWMDDDDEGGAPVCDRMDHSAMCACAAHASGSALAWLSARYPARHGIPPARMTDHDRPGIRCRDRPRVAEDPSARRAFTSAHAAAVGRRPAVRAFSAADLIRSSRGHRRGDSEYARGTVRASKTFRARAHAPNVRHKASGARQPLFENIDNLARSHGIGVLIIGIRAPIIGY